MESFDIEKANYMKTLRKKDWLYLEYFCFYLYVIFLYFFYLDMFCWHKSRFATLKIAKSFKIIEISYLESWKTISSIIFSRNLTTAEIIFVSK